MDSISDGHAPPLTHRHMSRGRPMRPRQSVNARIGSIAAPYGKRKNPPIHTVHSAPKVGFTFHPNLLSSFFFFFSVVFEEDGKEGGDDRSRNNQLIRSRGFFWYSSVGPVVGFNFRVLCCVFSKEERVLVAKRPIGWAADRSSLGS